MEKREYRKVIVPALDRCGRSWQPRNPPIINEEEGYNLFKGPLKNISPENKLKKYIIPGSFLPNINKLPQKPIQIKYRPNYMNFNVSPQTGITIDTKTRITADNIAEFAYPLAQFVKRVKPDYIIVCDRGARIIGLAVHMMYGELYGVLPTQDHAIHFRKISRKVPESSVRDALRADVARMLAATEQPTVLVLDDWVTTGGTKTLVQDVLRDLSGGKINLLYGVMRGTGADVTGKKDNGALGDWTDRADLIGVNYYGSTLERHKVESPAAIAYRRKMSENIHNFVQQLTPRPV